MKRVVSGGPTRSSLVRGLRRPSRYNPVELSRFAVGARPLVFLSPAGLALDGSAATLSLADSLPVRFRTPDLRPCLPPQRSILPVFYPSFRHGTGNPRSAPRDGRLEDLMVKAFSLQLRTVEGRPGRCPLMSLLTGWHGREFPDHDHSPRATDRADSGWSDRRRTFSRLPRFLGGLRFARRSRSQQPPAHG